MKKMHVLVLLLITVRACDARAELPGMLRSYESQPTVGKPMPDFTLDNITHFKMKSASLSDFRNQWLFLDFWFVNCISCIQSFPKINAMQQAFPNEIQYMLVGVTEEKRFGGGNIKKVYEKIREKLNLNLASAYDSVLMDRWEISSMPHIIIIDPAGIVRYITSGADMTVEKVRQLIKGQPVSFKRKDVTVPEYNTAKFPGSEDDKLVYRSILTKYNGERAGTPVLDDYVKWPIEYRKNGLKITAASLTTLYRLAYYGNSFWSVKDAGNDMYFYPDIILEVKDGSLFSGNWTTYEGIYNYNLAVPSQRSNDLEFIKQTMQSELKHAFGFEAKLEKREMPIWKLVAKRGAVDKLKTKGGNKYIGDGTGSSAMPAGFKAINIPTQKLLELILFYDIGFQQPPFFDETGIHHNIDIVMDADMTKFNDIKRSLQKNGLDLVKGTREFLVLVIKDAEE